MRAVEVVKRDQVPQPVMEKDFPAKVFAELLEVTGTDALKVQVSNHKSGTHLKKRLQEIADKERIAKTVRFSRSKQGTEFYFWLEIKS